MSRSVILASSALAALVLVVAVATMLEGVGSGTGGEARVDEIVRRVEERFSGLERRLADLERRVGLARGGRSENAEETAASASEVVAESDEEAPGARIARIDDRVGVLETIVDGLRQDPIQRAYSYVNSSSARLRRQGIDILENFARSDPEARDALRALLDDPDDEVREDAVEALAEAGDRESVPRLLALLEDTDAGVREEVIESVRELLDGDDVAPAERDAASRAIVASLADGSSGVREEAADILGDLEARHAIPALIQALQDEDDDVREEAMDSLADLGDPQAVAPLRAFYEKAEGWDVLRAARELARLGDTAPLEKEAARLREVALSNPDAEARRDAVRALGWVGGEAYRTVLEQALEDPSSRVRGAARRAIRELDDD